MSPKSNPTRAFSLRWFMQGVLNISKCKSSGSWSWHWHSHCFFRQLERHIPWRRRYSWQRHRCCYSQRRQRRASIRETWRDWQEGNSGFRLLERREIFTFSSSIVGEIQSGIRSGESIDENWIHFNNGFWCGQKGYSDELLSQKSHTSTFLQSDKLYKRRRRRLWRLSMLSSMTRS